VELERPKPPRVRDEQGYWTRQPPVLSARCTYWVRQILRGWRPPRRVACLGYHGATVWYGAYLWEYLNVLFPLLHALERSQYVAAAHDGRPWPAESGLGWTRAMVGRDGAGGAWEFARGDRGLGSGIVNEVAFAEEPGGPVTFSWPTPRALTFVVGDLVAVSVPLDVVIVEAARKRPHMPMRVTVEEAAGDLPDGADPEVAAMLAWLVGQLDYEQERVSFEAHVPVVNGAQDSWAWFQGSESVSLAELRHLASTKSDRPGYRAGWGRPADGRR
jgi:hypothetical protein